MRFQPGSECTSRQYEVGLVSVVIPTFNHARFISHTLESVFRQTFTKYEVIVVNDGSPDNTAEILAPLVRKKQIHYLEQANAGQAAARNAGLALSRGEYLAFLDDDDLWPSDKLEWQARFLQLHPKVGMVGGTAAFIDANGATCHNALPESSGIKHFGFEDLLSWCPWITPGQTLIRAQLLHQLGGMRSDVWGADEWDISIRASKLSGVVMVNLPAVLYRIHDLNAHKTQTGRMLRSMIRVVRTNAMYTGANANRDLLKKGMRGLPRCFAETLLLRARHEFVHGCPRRSFRSITELMPFVPWALWDPPVLWRLMRVCASRSGAFPFRMQ